MSSGLNGRSRSQQSPIEDDPLFAVLTLVLTLGLVVIGASGGAVFGIVPAIAGTVLGMITGLAITHVLVNHSRKQAGIPPFPFWQ